MFSWVAVLNVSTADKSKIWFRNENWFGGPLAMAQKKYAVKSEAGFVNLYIL
jgi:hypothetical protein